MKRIRLRVPGKLMMAGEYAVLEQNQMAIVAAVDRYVRVTISTYQENRLSLPDLDIPEVAWHYEAGQVKFTLQDPRLVFIERAIAVVHQYISELTLIPPCHLTVKSELDDSSGRKYGLGSSAAIVVGVVSALLYLSSQKSPGRDLIFKLAAIAHFQAQGSGSGADVAASVFGGWIRYTSFYQEWLTQRLASGDSIRRIVEGRWPFISIKRLTLPDDLSLCVGWTGKPASTKSLIKRVQNLREDRPEIYSDFLEESQHAVSQIVKGMQTADSDLMLRGLTKNRVTLKKIGRYVDIPIETPSLKSLANLTEQQGGAGKLSGAGGGDCGIALVPDSKADAIKTVWRQAGIEPLSIQCTQKGVSVM